MGFFMLSSLPRGCPQDKLNLQGQTVETMLAANLGLISEVPDVELSELTRVAAAIQKQITRDFAPIWNLDAGITAFGRVEDIPVDYWIVTLCYSVPEGSGGHRDADGRPAAFVEWTDNWSLTASHEVLEMLADPWGKRLVAGPSIKPGQGRVEYLIEVSDPCQSMDCAYAVNGETMSDFYTPRFFDPVVADGVRYSFSGKITEPRQVLKGGYLSWFDSATQHWWQAQWYDGANPNFVDCGELLPEMSFRAQIDARSRRTAKKPLTSAHAKRLQQAKQSARNAAECRGKRFSKYLQSFKKRDEV